MIRSLACLLALLLAAPTLQAQDPKEDKGKEEKVKEKAGNGDKLLNVKDKLTDDDPEDSVLLIRGQPKACRCKTYTLRMKKGERNIVYLSPSQGGFRASFVLGEKAVKAALDSGLPARVVKMIREAKRYPEGRAVRIDVDSAGDVLVIKKLVEIKLGS